MRVPVGLLAESIAVESLDQAGAGWVGRAVAADTESGGAVFAAEGTCLAVR